jgi:YjbE family integral membrane protein
MIDPVWFHHVSFDIIFFSQLLSIFVINLILSGDNAVLIALAVRQLPKRQRLWGIVLGSLLAVALRVVLTYFAAQLLMIAFLKLIGGMLIAWIAVRLFVEGEEDKEIEGVGNLWQAIRIIVVADLIMSLDNVLAIAGASEGDMLLLLIGLGMSIPLVVGTSTLLSMLMDRYPASVYIGAGILGKVAGEMIITDPWVHATFEPAYWVEITVQGVFVIGALAVGALLLRRKVAKQRLLLSQMNAGEAVPVQTNPSKGGIVGVKEG